MPVGDLQAVYFSKGIQMHIVLGALGVVVTILILVNRLSDNGIDIGWLNPFAWKRRREWAKKYHANPIYSLKTPMEVTALIMVALAKSEGEISTGQKQEIKHKFQEVFHLNDDKASALLASSFFLIKDDVQAITKMDKLLQPSINEFSLEQVSSALELMSHIANFDSQANSFQREIIMAFKHSFEAKLNTSSEWV
ncbi:MAG: TerB family tellurite resistance protein [Candidatus Thiodiazotropha sp. (ex Codakia rugifera)]|nr:TerB family tellurite resistance protein [Candidatus Thiodiazotropha sp. (ex Codakia rugifera)]